MNGLSHPSTSISPQTLTKESQIQRKSSGSPSEPIEEDVEKLKVISGEISNFIFRWVER